MTEKPWIFVVDDEEMVRQALDTLLRSVGYRVRTFDAAQSLYEDPALEEASCIVLDVRLPIVSGLDFQERLAEKKLGTPIIFMTGHGDIPMTVRAMKAGAADFLPKPFRDQEMLDAVASAVERYRVEQAASRAQSELQARYDGLSPRERQVMALATSGLMNKQIAGELGLSEITVKLHRGNLMRKIEAATFADLVKMAEALGLDTGK